MAQIVDVIIPASIKPRPEQHEIEIAWILARHYGCIVEFLQPSSGYRTKTPDMVMDGALWELKSPQGSSRKHTLKDQFSRAKGKKSHLVLDARRTKLDDDFLLAKIAFELKTHRSVQRLIFISKTGEVLEVK